MLKNIKFGVKIATRNFNFIPEIYTNKSIIDYIEIILMSDFTSKDIEIIKNLEMPYALHIPNAFYGIDFGDISKNAQNLEYIEKINKYVNDLNPLCVIIHPETGDINLSIENIKKIKLKPLALENMPYKSLVENDLLGYDILSLREYFKQIPNLEFCLDINHAIKVTISKKIDYQKFIKELIAFKKPIIFHISGGNLNKEKDEHLPLDKGDYNIAQIKEILFEYKEELYLTFETPKDYRKGIKDDLWDMKIFLES